MSRNTNGQFVAGSISERRRSWVGERFGKLEVIDVAYGVMRGNKTRTICTCKCDCGNIIETVSDNLSGKKKVSCGCDSHERSIQRNRVDLTGQRFGKLVVNEMIWGQPRTKCRCTCDCGNETIVINTQLTSGKTKSCGCYHAQKCSESNTKDFAGKSTDSGIIFTKPIRKNTRGVWIWECICPKCGNHFNGVPARLNTNGQISCGCVGTSTSKKENYIAKILSENHISYSRNYMFNDCADNRPLRFDFVIFRDGNPVHVIEFDGIQHYQPVDYFGGEGTYNKCRKHDDMKNAYCESKNIHMTRLPYTMSYGEIKDVIQNIINP